MLINLRPWGILGVNAFCLIFDKIQYGCRPSIYTQLYLFYRYLRGAINCNHQTIISKTSLLLLQLDFGPALANLMFFLLFYCHFLNLLHHFYYFFYFYRFFCSNKNNNNGLCLMHRMCTESNKTTDTIWQSTSTRLNKFSALLTVVSAERNDKCMATVS